MGWNKSGSCWWLTNDHKLGVRSDKSKAQQRFRVQQWVTGVAGKMNWKDIMTPTPTRGQRRFPQCDQKLACHWEAKKRSELQAYSSLLSLSEKSSNGKTNGMRSLDKDGLTLHFSPNLLPAPLWQLVAGCPFTYLLSAGLKPLSLCFPGWVCCFGPTRRAATGWCDWGQELWSLPWRPYQWGWSRSQAKVPWWWKSPGVVT